MGKEHTPSDPAIISLADKELEHARNQFNTAKTKYQNLSTATIDKAVLLNMKREVDYRVHLERLVRLKGTIAGRSDTNDTDHSGDGVGGHGSVHAEAAGAALAAVTLNGAVGRSELYGGSGSPFEGSSGFHVPN
jgi:hypothetical protein